MVTLNVSLDSPTVDGSQQPIAWSMQPMHDMDTVKYSDTAEISANVQLISAKLGGGKEVEVKNEFVTPFGLQTATPYWVFTPTESRRLSGAYQCKLIVRASAVAATLGEVTIDVSLDRQGFYSFLPLGIYQGYQDHSCNLAAALWKPHFNWSVV